MKVSIIVPIYNVASFLRRGVDSVLAQSFGGFELILVDDGSTDDSGVICDEYAAKDERIRVIHKDNRGVSSARNEGLNIALGEWVYFMDPDDELVPDALMTLVNGISEEVDVVLGGYEEIGLNGNLTNSMSVHPERVLDRTASLRPLFLPYSTDYSPSNGYLGYVFIRLFRMSVIQENHLRFDEKLRLRECALFVANFLCVSRGVTKDVGVIVYRYFRRESSATIGYRRAYDRSYVTSFDANVKIADLICNIYPSDSEIVRCAKEEVMNQYRQIKRVLARFGLKDGRLLRGLRVKCIRELGAPFVVDYVFNWKWEKVKKKLSKR